ncbi:MAG: peptidoglycan DD-metalloendopeptidase family protein, partial [Chitinivibrionales bacterium]|nr:peptidoglycan DD-metalloendopeptidase family protein [Chitinivibrionales bacterium]
VLAARYHGAEKTFTAFGLRDSSGKMRYFDVEGSSVQKQFLKAPLRYSRISSGYSFSRKHPILGIFRPHLGIDYAAPRGTPVYAAADGVVTYSGWLNGYGNFVRLTHGASYTTCYGHLHRINSGIREGARVSQGQMLGTVGSTGLSTGPHLDYRMKVADKYVNPLTVDLPSGEAVPGERRAEFEHRRMLYSLMLDTRFGDAEGSWVVDIRMVQPTPSERITQLTDSTSDGAATGS